MNGRLSRTEAPNKQMITANVREVLAALTITVILSIVPVAGRADSKAVSAEMAAQEKEGCTRNLKAIYTAIEAYRKDHKDLPNWFSDLVPDYLTDVNVLVCPVCKRTGETDVAPLLDPRIASSYLFEFCPVPLGASAPAHPKATRREWKRLQMGIVGSIVPIVRCRHHQPTLNLSFDGRVYESTPNWENMLTNMVDPESLTPSRIFASAGSGYSAVAKKTFPARDPKTPPQLVDLAAYYNARLSDSWHGEENAVGNELGGLSAGVQNIGGIEYDVRGLIQLGSRAPNQNRFPTNILGIKVNQKCQKVHFLHSGAFGRSTDEGKQIGAYIVHFKANQMRLEIPIIYGKDVRDWHFWPDERDGDPAMKVVWKGENDTSKRAHSYIRLFETTWTNLVPQVELESIDFVSSMAQPAPFLVAITLE